MKIIFNREDNVICYTQLKDIAYLAYYTGDDFFRKKYLEIINKGIDINSFIKVEDKRTINSLLLCEDIINYMDYKHSDTYMLTRLVSVNFRNNFFNSNTHSKKDDDLCQLLHFKRTNEGLKLPIVNDGEVYYSNNDFEFFSSLIDGLYVLRPLNGELEDMSYNDFLDQCLNDLDDSCDHTSVIVDNNLFVKTFGKPKKELFKLGKKKKTSQ